MTRAAGLAVGFAVLVAALFGAIAMEPNPTAADAPHDEVTDIEFPVDHETSGWVLAIVRGRLMRSADGGFTWREIVRGLGGEVQKLRDVEISPVDPNVVWAVTQIGEILRSSDQGRSWTRTQSPAPIETGRLLAPPTDSDSVLVTDRDGSTIVRSGDGGRSWSPVTGPGDGKISARAWLADLATATVLAGDNRGRIRTSTDGGATWEITYRLGIDQAVTALVRDGDVVVALTHTGSVARLDGAEPELAVSDLPGGSVLSLTRGAGSGDPLWAVVRDHGPFRSDDGGISWMAVEDGLTRSEQAVAVGAQDFRSVAAAPGPDGLILLAGFDGLFARMSGSDRWAPVETLVDYIAGLAVSPAFADDRTLYVTTYVRGAFRSTDGGESWDLANEGITAAKIAEGNRFLPLRRMHNVHFSPDYPDTGLVLSATWLRGLRSVDGGGWEEMRIGDAPGSLLRQFVIAPSPSHDRDGTVFVGTRQGELFESTAGGEPGSWELRSEVGRRIRSIAPSPSVADDRTIFLGTTASVLRSFDGGRTWTDLGVRNAVEVTGRETDFGIQVALSPEFVDDGLVLAATDAGLWESHDGGDTWDEHDLGVTPAPIEAVAFSPTFADDGLILVSTRSAGLMRSQDGGASYQRIAPELWEANLLIADYANPSSIPIRFSPTYDQDATIFAFAQHELLRSTDAGASWETIPLPSAAEVAAVTTPTDPGLLTRDRAKAGAAAMLVVFALAGGGWLVLRRRRATG